MGVYYTLYVLPEPDSMEYRPHGRAIADVLDVLHEEQWAQREAAYKVEVTASGGGRDALTVAHADRARVLTDCTTRGRGVLVRLTGLPDEHFWPDATSRDDGLSRKYDIREDESGIFGPQYCDELTLLWSPELIAVPNDAYRDSAVTCPACGSNAEGDLPTDFPDLRALDSWDVRAYPSRECANCGAVLNLRALAAPGEDGSSIDAAPFAHLLLAVYPAPKATPGAPSHADPALLERLADVTGVHFRSIGRYA